MMTIEKTFPDWRELKIHESFPEVREASRKLKKDCTGCIATQNFAAAPHGNIVNGFKNEDLENQTFDNENFDLLITQDVFEHVYAPERAFSEITRTLKPGGVYILTVLLVNKHKPPEIWAVKGENGKPKFLKDPEFHGNPIDPLGYPVTMHWGYDIVEFIQKSCGMETEIINIDDLNFGIRAEYNEVLISRKFDLNSISEDYVPTNC